MFVELVDQLRCPEDHDTTWMVLAATETRDRHVITGTLGCPACNTRYVVAEGTVWFAARPPGPASGAPDPAEDWPLRLAAFLGLAEGRGVVGLYGRWADHAEALGDIVRGIEPLAIDPAGPTHPMLSAIVPPSRAVIPLAAASLRAVAVDDVGVTGEVLAEAVRIVRAGGRILAPARASLPAGVHELARDGDWWVAERDGVTGGIVPIRRGTRDGTSSEG